MCVNFSGLFCACKLYPSGVFVGLPASRSCGPRKSISWHLGLTLTLSAWRKILKDIITYFKEIQTFYEQRSKSLLKLANVLNNVHMPPGFLPSGGLDDAVQVLRNYNAQTILEANKAREIEEDVILALTGLRTDLQLKIKEIKGLHGDFKNSVEKEIENTRRAVRILQENLGKSELDSALTTGKEDPYLLRLAVDRQLERQLDEENYLHQVRMTKVGIFENR